MTDQQVIIAGGSLITILMGVIAWFTRKLISDLERLVGSLNMELKDLKSQFNTWRVTAEQNFVSFDTFETMRIEFRTNFTSIFQTQAKQGEILARLDERSKSDDKIEKILDRLAPPKGRR